MATAKKSASSDARKGRSRYVDQKGQWTNQTPQSTKKRQQAAWKKLEKSMKAGK